MVASVLRVTLFLIALTVALAMTVAGLGKFLDPALGIKFLKSGYGVHAQIGTWIIYAIAIVELLLGLALAYGNGRWTWPAVTLLALTGGFMGLLVGVHLRHPHVAIDCGCFGALQAPLAGQSILSHLQFNAALIVLLLSYIGLLSLNRRRLRRVGSARPFPSTFEPIATGLHARE
jgi:hypothetical protein